MPCPKAGSLNGFKTSNVFLEHLVDIHQHFSVVKGAICERGATHHFPCHGGHKEF